MRPWLLTLAALVLGACSGGAVVFAPTAPPPDVSPLVYAHPSGSFSAAVPRAWSVYEQHTTVLASAAFTPPGAAAPAVRFAVVDVGQQVDSAGFAALIERYQSQVRPDLRRYTPADRAAMGDGSWRLTGLRQSVGGETEVVNTFLQRQGGLVGLAEVTLGAGVAFGELERIVNTFSLNPAATLEPTEIDTLLYAAPTPLEFQNVTSWLTPAGVFFITGEVVNRGGTTLTEIPVRAVLKTGDGLGVAEAVDMLMGYGLPPGGFAPFSLRFGQGQPPLTVTYDLFLGGAEWVPAAAEVIGAPTLTWTDDNRLNADGSLAVSGMVRNAGEVTARAPRAVVTVFDDGGRVIAAAFSEVAVELMPGAEAAFSLLIPEMGGRPANTVVTVQARP